MRELKLVYLDVDEPVVEFSWFTEKSCVHSVQIFGKAYFGIRRIKAICQGGEENSKGLGGKADPFLRELEIPENLRKIRVNISGHTLNKLEFVDARGRKEAANPGPQAGKTNWKSFAI